MDCLANENLQNTQDDNKIHNLKKKKKNNNPRNEYFNEKLNVSECAYTFISNWLLRSSQFYRIFHFYLNESPAVDYSFDSNFWYLFFQYGTRSDKQLLYFYAFIDQHIPLISISIERMKIVFLSLSNDIHLIQYHDNNNDWNVSILVEC